MKSLYLNTTLAMLLLLAATACKIPVQPAPQIQDRDTVHSTVRASLTAPGMVNALWEVRTPADTLSSAAITSLGDTTTKSVISSGGVYVFHNIRENEPYINLLVAKHSNLRTAEVARADNGKPLALRSWNIESLSVYFRILNNSFTAPYVVSTLNDFQWLQSEFSERIVSDGNGKFSIITMESARYTNTQYSSKAQYLSNPKLYQSKVERAWMMIDEYDIVKNRVSGRFSFRLIDSITGEVVDIQNGTFTNVYLQRYAN
jgi:hypothetical protein